MSQDSEWERGIRAGFNRRFGTASLIASRRTTDALCIADRLLAVIRTDKIGNALLERPVTQAM